MNYLYVVIIVILSPQSLIASEIETPSPDQSIPTGIYVKEGTTLVGEMNSTEVQSETIIYVSSGTTLVGKNNIIISKVENILLNFDSNVEVNDDKNNILGVSKGFIPQIEVKDKILKSHQEKNIERVKNTWFVALHKKTIPVFKQSTPGSGIVSSSSFQFTFGTIQIIFHDEFVQFFPKFQSQKFYTSFVYIETYKTEDLFLRGPPSLLLS